MEKLYCIFLLWSTANAVSPVLKVVQLLDECKAKVAKDLAAETAAMEKFSAFCDDELKDKAFAIETSMRQINGFKAVVEDSTAKIGVRTDEILTISTQMSHFDKDGMAASDVRKNEHKLFVAAEKELIESADVLARATALIKGGMSFAQSRGASKKKLGAMLRPMTSALLTIIESQWVNVHSRSALQSFLQSNDAEEDDQPQAKMVAYESSSGGIVAAIESLQGQAQDTLADLRSKETSAQQMYESLEGQIKLEVKHSQDKIAAATSAKAAATEALAKAQGDLAEATKTKEADEAYAATLKSECESKAAEWDSRQTSAKEEMQVIEKAKQILTSGVKAFLQVRAKTTTRKYDFFVDVEEQGKSAVQRKQLVSILGKLAAKHHSFALTQMASMARSDPFTKVKNLIEEMVSKLINEANEDATHEAFCQEATSKSTSSQMEKQTQVDQYNSRIDLVSTTITELIQNVKTLEAEVANIDQAQAEATEQRASEHEDYVSASTDFKDSAQAVSKAIEVLRNFYGGALLQVATKISSMKAGPDFGSAKGDTSHTIIAVLEMAQEDFTKLLAEAEATEDEAASSYAKLSDENKVSKATKLADVKGMQSEITSLKVQLEHSKEDYASVDEELKAVTAYLEKLRPQCESQAKSFAERKAAREAEITGLKQALEIISGNAVALVQTQHHLRSVHRM
jgi:predicted  nucleic acid-binding Zn-ribbon protein